MDPADGARTFLTTGDAYDAFMGRYSVPLAASTLAWLGVRPGLRALDAGCGPGALTGALVAALGPDAVAACDPSPPFVAECAARHPGVEVRPGRLEDLPFADDAFDLAIAQLVLHFVADPAAGAAELRRVVRPGGRVAASVWDATDGMELLRAFWDAAVAVDPDAPDELRVLRFGQPGEIAAVLAAAGLVDVRETTIEVESVYGAIDDLWDGLAAGVGPAGAHYASLSPDRRLALQAALHRRLGSPDAAFTLRAVARVAAGTVPG